MAEVARSEGMSFNDDIVSNCKIIACQGFIACHEAVNLEGRLAVAVGVLEDERFDLLLNGETEELRNWWSCGRVSHDRSGWSLLTAGYESPERNLRCVVGESNAAGFVLLRGRLRGQRHLRARLEPSNAERGLCARRCG